ncbi:MAG: sulfite exporter TauE/SafE family protein [Alphaproteobacteria bacterium]|nr:sulfite exporter TauE/SafE family protein [Alphaproteobacteria bacterium]
MIELATLTDLLAALAAQCRIAVTGNMALLSTMLLAGFVGGASHCAGMCGPFVLAQVTARAERTRAEPLTELHRLRGGLLVPYHLGRLTTYAGLGALSAGLVGGLADITQFQWIAAVFLLLAAALFLVSTFGALRRFLPNIRRGGTTQSTAALSRMAGPLMADPRGARGYALGLLLGFLPCGLLYGALAAAAAAGGGPLGGAFAMMAFTLGTVPALLGVGFAGHFFARRWMPQARAFASVLMLVNAGTLTVLAWRTVA